MNYETLYHHWFITNAMACQAERQIHQAIETCRSGEGLPPSPEEIAYVRRLRAIASDYLDAAMKEIWRQPAQPAHQPGRRRRVARSALNACGPWNRQWGFEGPRMNQPPPRRQAPAPMRTPSGPARLL